MPLHAPLPPASPQPPEEPPLPDEELSSKESEYESSDDEDRQRFVMSNNTCLDSKTHKIWEKDSLGLLILHIALHNLGSLVCPSPRGIHNSYRLKPETRYKT